MNAARVLDPLKNIGPLDPPARYGVSGVPHDGPWIELWVRVERDSISQALYCSHGCPVAVACGSMICDLVRGRTVEMAMQIEAES